MLSDEEVIQFAEFVLDRFYGATPEAWMRHTTMLFGMAEREVTHGHN